MIAVFLIREVQNRSANTNIASSDIAVESDVALDSDVDARKPNFALDNAANDMNFLDSVSFVITKHVLSERATNSLIVRMRASC